MGPYGNPAHKAVGNLIVLNDDEIAHGIWPTSQRKCRGRDSYVREGTVTHRDDQGNIGKTHAGDVQVMSAGTGIGHSEENEEDVPIRLFQIWLKSSAAGGIPRWGNKPFPKADRAGAFVLLASGRSAEGALPTRSDAEVYGALLQAGARASFSFSKGDSGYSVPATGGVEIGSVQVGAREGLVIENEKTVAINALTRL